MITKPTIIVTSLGRTGTLFFAHLFRRVIPNCTSLHEPDVVGLAQPSGVNPNLQSLGHQIRESGFRNIILRKVIFRWSLRHISDARLKGEIDAGEAATRITAQRLDFIMSRPGAYYVESSLGYYGLIDILPQVFKDHRVVLVVRDGRDWIRSVMNFSSPPRYDRGLIRRFFSPDWPGASEFPSDPQSVIWDQMSEFEKLCWAWAHLNEYALNSVQDNPNARVFRFEELFNRQNGYQELREMVRFTTTFLGIQEVREDLVELQARRKVHQSRGVRLPEYSLWTGQQRQMFESTCGSLMNRMGYAM